MYSIVWSFYQLNGGFIEKHCLSNLSLVAIIVVVVEPELGDKKIIQPGRTLLMTAAFVCIVEWIEVKGSPTE